MNGNKSVTANFTQNNYSLTINAANGTVGKSPDKTSYVYGDVVTLTATASAGYSFNSWSGDITGSTNPTTITINGVGLSLSKTFATIKTSLSPRQTPRQ